MYLKIIFFDVFLSLSQNQNLNHKDQDDDSVFLSETPLSFTNKPFNAQSSNNSNRNEKSRKGSSSNNNFDLNIANKPFRYDDMSPIEAQQQQPASSKKKGTQPVVPPKPASLVKKTTNNQFQASLVNTSSGNFVETSSISSFNSELRGGNSEFRSQQPNYTDSSTFKSKPNRGFETFQSSQSKAFEPVDVVRVEQ